MVRLLQSTERKIEGRPGADKMMISMFSPVEIRKVRSKEVELRSMKWSTGKKIDRRGPSQYIKMMHWGG
jgi:hypothetical protein